MHRAARHRPNRAGNSLCELLLALVLLSATAAWALQAAAMAERALTDARNRRSALHRADHALAELNALPCDSVNIVRNITEPRWSLTATRDHDGRAWSDDVTLHSRTGDTLRLHLGGWCD